MVKLDGSYAYEKVLSLIDYNGDIKRKKKSGVSSYSATFSPNNIRTLIISPDGAIVRYFLSTGKGKVAKVKFDSVMLQKAQSFEDYKPMITALYDDRVCASIEEIILVTTSANGTVKLSSQETNIGMLVKGFRGQTSSSDVKTSIMERYKRLYAVSIFNGTMQSFLQGFSSEPSVSLPTNLISDQGFMDSAIKTYFHKEDWYRGYGFSANFYDFDRKDGQLNKYFNATKESMESKEKDDKIAQFSKERHGALDDKYKEELNKYKGIYNCYTMLTVILSNGSTVLAGSCEIRRVQPLQLEKFKGFVETKGITFMEESGANYTDVLTNNIKLLNNQSKLIYLMLMDCMLSRFKFLAEDNPLCAKLIGNNINRAIRIPDTLESTNEWLKSVTDGELYFEGARWNDSIANACTQTCTFFASKHTERSVKSFQNKEYWMGVLK